MNDGYDKKITSVLYDQVKAGLCGDHVTAL